MTSETEVATPVTKETASELDVSELDVSELDVLDVSSLINLYRNVAADVDLKFCETSEALEEILKRFGRAMGPDLRPEIEDRIRFIQTNRWRFHWESQYVEDFAARVMRAHKAGPVVREIDTVARGLCEALGGLRRADWHTLLDARDATVDKMTAQVRVQRPDDSTALIFISTEGDRVEVRDISGCLVAEAATTA